MVCSHLDSPTLEHLLVVPTLTLYQTLPLSLLLSGMILILPRGGSIYYRLDNTSSTADQVQLDVYNQFPDVDFFYPLLVFVATWDRVAAFSSNFRDTVNTFQVVIASDGTRSFVRFSYEDIQWGGSTTLIGISAGDRVNFITHPASLSSSVLLLDNTTTTYKFEVDRLSKSLSKLMLELQY